MPFAVRAYDGGLPYQQQMDIAGRADGQPVYIGWADPGKATSDAVWRIYKITYDASGNATAITFASNSTNFDKVFDDRTTYTYG